MSDFEWDVVYESAIRPDGSLLFPERLSREFLDRARRSQGSRIFANQYLNQVVSAEDRVFKPEWRKYWHVATELPFGYTFSFLDLAVSLADGADYTALATVTVDERQTWWVRIAKRARVNPTEAIEWMFQNHSEFRPLAMGVETVAYQKAFVHFLREEMIRRNIFLPIREINRGPDTTKEMRILRMVPQFEFGSIRLAHGMKDLEDELEFFPRGAHDDLLDALSSIHDIVTYPTQARNDERPESPTDPRYESWFIRQLHRRQNNGDSGD